MDDTKRFRTAAAVGEVMLSLPRRPPHPITASIAAFLRRSGDFSLRASIEKGIAKNIEVPEEVDFVIQHAARHAILATDAALMMACTISETRQGIICFMAALKVMSDRKQIAVTLSDFLGAFEGGFPPDEAVRMLWLATGNALMSDEAWR